MTRPPLHRRLWPWLFALLLAGYCALGISRVRFEVDVTRLLPDDLPEATGARLYMQHFLRPGQVLMLVESTSAEETEAAAARVAKALQSLTEEIAHVTWQRAEEEAAVWSELAAWVLLNQSRQDWDRLEARLTAERLDATLNDYLEDLATSPLLQDSLAGYDPLGLLRPLLQELGAEAGPSSEFASADGRLRVIYVELHEASRDYRATARLLEKVRATATAAAGEEATLSLTGEPAFLAEISLSMEQDMRRSAISTLLLTTLLVWVVFRQLRLLPLLALCLGLTFALTLATCGLLTGTLTALTVGFGSILIGLSADYGVLVVQARRNEGGNALSAARLARPGVLWAMSTTAAVFLALLPLGFPGLSDLGLLVACGVVIGAAVMLIVLPRALDKLGGTAGPLPPVSTPSARAGFFTGLLGFLALAACAVGLLARGLPQVDAASGSIRPRDSEAYAAIEKLEVALGSGPSAVHLLVATDDTEAMPDLLSTCRTALNSLRTQGQVTDFALPDRLWPDTSARNAALTGPVSRLLAEEARLRQAVEAAGFTDAAWELTGAVLAHWRSWQGTGAPVWPAQAGARWLLERVLSRPASSTSPGAALLGTLTLPANARPLDLQAALPAGCYPVGGGLLNATLDRYLSQGFVGISLLFASVTLLLLALALRAWRPWLLVTCCLALSYAALLGLMSWLDLRWNAFTLPALLLSLGTGSDYFIHLILRLQKGEATASSRAALAPALIVCAGSSILGFGSLLTASSAGLASMGLVCAAALALNLACALLVLPWLWDLTSTTPRVRPR